MASQRFIAEQIIHKLREADVELAKGTAVRRSPDSSIARNRLTRTQEGHWNGSNISTLWRDQQWTLSQTGNWARDKEDWNGDGDFTDTGEVDDTRTSCSDSTTLIVPNLSIIRHLGLARPSNWIGCHHGRHARSQSCWPFRDCRASIQSSCRAIFCVGPGRVMHRLASRGGAG